MKEVIQAFDDFLLSKRLTFEAVIIGGGALIILDVIDRKTKDIDCLDPKIPESVVKASMEFARTRQELGLWERWLNNDPLGLKQDLPSGWQDRLQEIYRGKALKFDTLGRSDLLKSKLFAYCDRTEPDRSDLLCLKPTSIELLEAISWVKMRDSHPMWIKHVDVAFSSLGKELGHGES